MSGEIYLYRSAVVNVTTERHFAGVVVFEVKEAIVTKPHVLETNKPDVRLGQRRIRVLWQ